MLQLSYYFGILYYKLFALNASAVHKTIKLCAVSSIHDLVQLYLLLLISFYTYYVSILLSSPGSKKTETIDQRDSIVLTPKNVQASRKQERYRLQLSYALLLFTYAYNCLILDPGTEDTL
jgi:hypothetical protein